MGKYDVEVLNALLDKFEKSKLSKEGSQRSLRLTIKSSHPILKDYWGEESYLYKDQIDMILVFMSSEKWSTMRMKNGPLSDAFFGLTKTSFF